MDFRFVEFNPRRVQRGAEGARVLVLYDAGPDDLLWMSRADIRRNMKAFGRHPELVKAIEAYEGKPLPQRPALIGEESADSCDAMRE